MLAWEAIQGTLDYIEDHIHQTIEIEELAKLAALSPFYYQRLFSRLVKKPVREYIKLRRLAHAGEALKRKDVRILDVALELGFGSHETLTRAFGEAYGMTPEQYRKSSGPLNHFIKPDLMLAYTMIDEGVPLISDGLVLEVNRKTLRESKAFEGIRGYVPIAGQVPVGEATGTDVPGEIWGRFHKVKEKLPRVPGGHELGVAYQGDAPEGCFTYFAGAETADTGENEQFWLLPACEYAVFGFEAENFRVLTTVALDKVIRYSGTWLQRHGLRMGGFSAEMYFGNKPDTDYMELWLPVSNPPASPHGAACAGSPRSKRLK